ncbi:hypothetical protein Peur_055521 [Populus x canadensis]
MAVIVAAKICPFVTFKTMNRSSRPDVDSKQQQLPFLPSCYRLKINQQEEKDDVVVGAINSLFDPNEKTKSGRFLPKAYLKEDPKDIAKFRRTAGAAKESIREYLGSWRGRETVACERCVFNVLPLRVVAFCHYLLSWGSLAGIIAANLLARLCSIQRQRICIEQIQGNQILTLCTNAYGFSFQIG